MNGSGVWPDGSSGPVNMAFMVAEDQAVNVPVLPASLCREQNDALQVLHDSVKRDLRELESAGEGLAVEARTRMASIAGEDPDHPAWSSPQAAALQQWNEARSSLRPETPPGESALPQEEAEGE